MSMIRTAVPLLRQRLSRQLTAHPFLRLILRALGAGSFSYVLSGSGLLSDHVPLALSVVCVLPFELSAVFAYLGAALGYVHFWGFSSALEPIAAGFLLLAGNCLFPELTGAQRRRFVPVAAGALYALPGMIFVLQANGTPVAVLKLALRLTLLIVSIRVLCPTQNSERLRPYAAAVCLLAGLVRIELPFGVPLAVCLAALLCLLPSRPSDALRIGAACGLVLDLGSTPSPPQTACFCLSLLVCWRSPLRRTARTAAFVGLYFLCVLIWGGEHAGWTLGVLAGALASCLLPPLSLTDADEASRPATASTLSKAADVFQQLETKLALSRPETQTAPALIFDSAADAVCRSCVKRQQCWQERAADTYRLLSACAETIVRQGQANRGDLPDGFCAVCIREDAFRAAVNQALHTRQAELLALRRSEEAQALCGALFGHLSRFLRTVGHTPAAGLARYQLVLGVRAVGLRGDTLCGDCGTSFLYGSTQYVLLCDGMGTGAAAQTDAQEAIALLQAFLTLGFAALDALALLNELYLLRADGCFSTVDLVELDLCSGEGTLYKWGAAPSYLKKGSLVKKIGTASPPPGLGVGEEHQIGNVRLSLQRGEQLVLTTDGIPQTACEQYLSTCGALAPLELAAGVVACASESEPDDRTAAVLQLVPVSAHVHHTTRRTRKVSNPDRQPHI